MKVNSKNLFYNVSPGSIKGTIIAPTSKSHANRALILAAISKKDIELKNIPPSTDVFKMLECFKKIGLKVDEKKDSVVIRGSFPNCENNIDIPLLLETGDGGTTNRFLISMLALGSREYHIKPLGHMINRPMDTLFDSLKKLGTSVERDQEYWLKLKGPVKYNNKKIEVDASVSSQFASGLRLSLYHHNIEVVPTGMKGSEDYYKMTCAIEDKFKNGIDEYIIPIDFSSLSYPVALSIFDQGLEVSNCFEVDPLQPDSSFLNIIKKTGGDYNFDKGILKITPPSSLSSLDIDCKSFPDLVPTLCFYLSYANGVSRLKNLDSLRVKECDRINEILKILTLFNIKAEVDHDDSIIIYGKINQPKVPSIDYHPPQDHRMIMLAYLFFRMNTGGKLYNYQYVNKSFSNFYHVMENNS